MPPHRWRKVKIAGVDTGFRVCELCELPRHKSSDPEACPGKPVHPYPGPGRGARGLTDQQFLACHYGLGPGRSPAVLLARLLAGKVSRVEFMVLPRHEQADRVEEARSILEDYVRSLGSARLDKLCGEEVE